MPTYEYRCLECDKTFEAIQKMTDEPLQECRFCGGAVKKLISTGAGLIFKGSGFYCTDYRNDSSNQGAKAETGSSDKADGASKESSDDGSKKKETSKEAETSASASS